LLINYYLRVTLKAIKKNFIFTFMTIHLDILAFANININFIQAELDNIFTSLKNTYINIVDYITRFTLTVFIVANIIVNNFCINFKNLVEVNKLQDFCLL